MIDIGVTIGGYLPVSSFLNRMDARFKITFFCILLYCTFTSNAPAVVMLHLLFIIFLAKISLAPMFIWFRRLKQFAPMLMITFALNLLFGSPGFYYKIGGVALPFGQDSLIGSITLTTQIVIAIYLALILTFSTSPSQLTHAMQWFASPLSWLGLPTQEFSVVIFMAMRFVPLFQQELYRIRDAQISRGLNFQSGNALTKSIRLLGLLHPAFVATVKRSEILAQAMSARGFVPGGPRTNFQEQSLSRYDLIATIVVLSYLGVRHLLSKYYYNPV